MVNDEKSAKLKKFILWLGFIGACVVFVSENWDRLPKPPIEGFNDVEPTGKDGGIDDASANTTSTSISRNG